MSTQVLWPTQGSQLRSMLADYKLSQREVAHTLGVPVRLFRYWVAGRKYMPVDARTALQIFIRGIDDRAK